MVFPASRHKIAKNSLKFSSYKSAILFNMIDFSSFVIVQRFAFSIALFTSKTVEFLTLPTISLLLYGFTIDVIEPEGSDTSCDDKIHFLCLNFSRCDLVQ